MDVWRCAQRCTRAATSTLDTCSLSNGSLPYRSQTLAHHWRQSRVARQYHTTKTLQQDNSTQVSNEKPAQQEHDVQEDFAWLFRNTSARYRSARSQSSFITTALTGAGDRTSDISRPGIVPKTLQDLINATQIRGPLPGRTAPKSEIKLGPAPMRLNPMTGRTVFVDPARGVDVAKAFKQLDVMCNQRGIKRELRAQMFHERPGLKRKRLRSQRWRGRFRKLHAAMLSRASSMRKMGW